MPDSLVQDSTGRNGAGAAGRSARPVPLAPAQQAALLPERLRRSPAANLFLALEISGELGTDAVRRAVTAVLTGHEILRSVFPDDRRVPYQRADELPGSVLELGEPDAGHVFDLVREHPVRVTLQRTGERAVLAFTVHPVAADDVSLELLAEEFFAALDTGEVTGSSFRAAVPALVKGMAVDPATDADAGYWLERLGALPERAVPVEPGAAARHGFRIAPEALADLTAGQDPAAAFAALLAGALSTSGLGADPVVGLLDPARDEATARTIGSFGNYLVLRGLAGATAPRQAVLDAAEVLSAARAHGSTRIEFLTHRLRGAAAVSGGALFQAALVVRSGSAVAHSGAGYTAREIDRRLARPHGVDLLVDVRLDDDGALVTVDSPAAPAALPEFVADLERRALAWADGRGSEAGVPGRDGVDVDASGGITLFQPPAGTAGELGPGLGGPPQTEAEHTLAAAIRTVLELDEDDEVGREDTFFSLGGDSIAALRLVTVLAEQGYALEVQTVFGFPAVRELAEQLEPAAEAAPEPQPAAAPLSASGLDPAVLAALGAKFGA
ncbi:condensation domain-containing protein [Nocardia harenae]|uniref:condensation domain-containing protein n=1 Tax=Nocardia harenae TaxID=358707 RepID=UPI0008301FE0|nr:condensation domain-containing protein [Nocardia harenae]